MPSYTTLTFAKTILQESGTSDDGTLHTLLPIASQAVENYCGQNFDARLESFGFSSQTGLYNPLLFLVHRPLLSISSLKNGNGDALGSTQYELLPKFNYPKAYIRLTATNYWRNPNDPAGATTCWPLLYGMPEYAMDAVEVVGEWGYVPHYTRAWLATGLTLSGAHSAGATTLVLSATPSSATNDLDIGSVVKVGSEQMRVTGPLVSFASLTSITVERAYNNTTAAAYAGGETISVFVINETIKLATAFVACALYVSRNNATGSMVNVGAYSYQMNPDIWGKARQVLVFPYYNSYYGQVG